MSGRVIVVGSVNVDLVVRSARLPVPGETVTGGLFERHEGGKGGNQAVAAARLGAAVRLLGAIGSDSFGDGALAALVAEGIDVSGVATFPDVATGIALILVDQAGENEISVASGVNALLDAAFVRRTFDGLGSLAGDVVLVSNELPAAVVLTALGAGAETGARTIFNPAPADGLVPASLPEIDILSPNRGELRLLARSDGLDFDMVAAARTLSFREALVATLGRDGALVVPRDGGAWSVPALAVDAIDTTGAGDAFNGALAAGLASGLDLDAAVRQAVAAGSLTTTRTGAREGMPTRAELEEVGAGSRVHLPRTGQRAGS